MATKAEKKESIRKDIIDAAQIYSSNLAGRKFLYVYGEEYFEVSFPTDCFLHLTGFETHLSARISIKYQRKEFYQIHSSIFQVAFRLQTRRRRNCLA